MKKTQDVEIPPSTTDDVFRMLLEQIAKTVKQARATRKERIKVTIQQGE